ncbi:hypothetical protein [Chitinophaga sp.]|uniref:hypothetical protein n=1 Tax=Chitinophaga sp. TaxID=1869181 RepID=UPI0031D92891
MEKKSGHKLLRQGVFLFVSTLIVNLGNYGINLLLGHWLPPADFSEVGLLATLLLLISFVAIGFQMTAARYIAGSDGAEPYAVIRWVRKLALFMGIIPFLLLCAGAGYLQDFFHTQSPYIFPIFGAGLPFYLLMSVNRGMLQGASRFGRLAVTYQTEMWVRLVLSILFYKAGTGIPGITFAITLSLVASYLVSIVATPEKGPQGFDRYGLLKFLSVILIYECSQILINNSDTVLVKHFFPPVDAGLYAAMALIGRIVYFSTWTVVTLLFPIVIRLEKEGRPHLAYFTGSLLVVAGVAAMIVLVCYQVPIPVITLLFGSNYIAVAPFLWKYALATGLFACANVFTYYNLSLERYLPVWCSLMAGVMQVFLICFIHNSFLQVINIQVYLMAAVIIVLLGLQLFYYKPFNEKVINPL